MAKKLVRRGYRLAKRLQGHFWVVHVHTPGETMGRHHHELEPTCSQLARSLGGNVEELSGDSDAEAISRLRPRDRATFIVIGASKRSRIDEVLRGSSLIARIMRETDSVDVLVVADPSKAVTSTVRRAAPMLPPLAQHPHRLYACFTRGSSTWAETSHPLYAELLSLRLLYTETPVLYCFFTRPFAIVLRTCAASPHEPSQARTGSNKGVLQLARAFEARALRFHRCTGDT